MGGTTTILQSLQRDEVNCWADDCPPGACHGTLYTYCEGKTKCNTTDDCPYAGRGAPDTCKEGSCYKGSFPLCLHNGTVEEKVECS